MNEVNKCPHTQPLGGKTKVWKVIILICWRMAKRKYFPGGLLLNDITYLCIEIFIKEWEGYY